MARTPSMTAEQAESILGPRGNLTLNNENKPTLRKWLSAHGFPALFAAGLSLIEMQNAYNKLDGSGLAAIQRKLDKAKAADDGELGLLGEPADEPAALPPAPTPPPVNATPTPVPVAPTGTLGVNHETEATLTALRELILGGYKPGIDAEQVRAIVNEQISGIAPKIIHVKHQDREAIEIKGRTHPEFERALKYLMNGANVMLVGPAGCGKSHLADQLSQALETSMTMLCGSAGASESEVKGWLLPVEGGKFEYCPSQFVTSYENGYCLICLDEMDAYDPNMLLSVNVPLANGHMYIPQRRDNPVVKRGPKVYFLGTMNTFGTGANPIYTARNSLDEASRDRWLFITVDYDKGLEEQIGTAGGLSVAEIAGIWELRDKCREAQLRRVISTRAFQKAVVMKQSGDSWKQIRDRLLEGWTKDERAKVGA